MKSTWSLNSYHGDETKRYLIDFTLETMDDAPGAHINFLIPGWEIMRYFEGRLDPSVGD